MHQPQILCLANHIKHMFTLSWYGFSSE